MPLTRKFLPLSFMVTTSIQHTHSRHRYSRRARGGAIPMGNRAASPCRPLRRIPSTLHKTTLLQHMQDAFDTMTSGKQWLASNTRLCSMLMAPFIVAVCIKEDVLVKPHPSGPNTLPCLTDLRIWQKDRRSATDQKIPASQLLGHNIDTTYQ